jgi:hypothetical protein
MISFSGATQEIDVLRMELLLYQIFQSVGLCKI